MNRVERQERVVAYYEAAIDALLSARELEGPTPRGNIALEWLRSAAGHAAIRLREISR